MREGSAKEEEEGCGGQEHRICFKYHITSGEEVFCENETKANSVSDKLKVTKSISGPAGIVQQTQWYAGKCLTTSSPLYPIDRPNVVQTSVSSVQSLSCV